MSHTITISSDVKVNGSAVGARFSSIALSGVEYPSEIAGHAALKKPISFTWRHQDMQEDNAADLGAIAANFVLRGPRRTLDGNVDAVVNDEAELCKIVFGVGGNQSVYGYITVETQAAGMTETTIVTVHPVDRLRFVGSSDYHEPNT